MENDEQELRRLLDRHTKGQGELLEKVETAVCVLEKDVACNCTVVRGRARIPAYHPHACMTLFPSVRPPCLHIPLLPCTPSLPSHALAHKPYAQKCTYVTALTFHPTSDPTTPFSPPNIVLHPEREGLFWRPEQHQRGVVWGYVVDRKCTHR